MATTITKNIVITGPVDSEYLDFAISASSTCVSITIVDPDDNSNRITGYTGTITVEFEFSNSACFTSIITVEATNDNGCTQQETFTLDNPCTGFTSQIVNGNNGGNPFSFAVTNTGGVQPYSIEWSWDNSLFTALQNSVNLTLTLIDGQVVPAATNIFATVTDGNGCVSQATFAYQFVSPTANNKNIMIFCNPDEKEAGSCGTVIGQSVQTQLVANTDDATTIDWTTLEITNSNQYLCASHLGDGIVIIYNKVASTPGTKTMTWSVANNYGIRSNSATLNIMVGECNSIPEVAIHDITRLLDPDDRDAADITYISIEDSIVPSSGRIIDWDTFAFTALTSQSISSGVLTTQNGTAELTNSRQIKYTVGGSTPLSVDVIAYSIDDDEGNSSNIGRIYVDFEASAAPAVPDQTRSVATYDSRTIDLLDSATGDPLPDNIVINTAPTNGAYTLNTDGTITYSPRIETEGTDQITYYVYNADGTQSAEITLDIDIIHAGGTNTISHCLESETVDVEGALSGTVTSGGTWSEYSGNPTTGISVASPDAIDFSSVSAVDGNYRFDYTVTDDGETTVGYVTVKYTQYGATHLTTTGGVGSTDVEITSRFQLTPVNIPFGNVRFQIHSGAAPLTPGSSNIINELAPTAHESTTGIFELKLTEGLGTALPALSGSDVYETRLKVTTGCGDIFYVVSNVEIS